MDTTHILSEVSGKSGHHTYISSHCISTENRELEQNKAMNMNPTKNYTAFKIIG